jgi:hypothetical protein
MVLPEHIDAILAIVEHRAAAILLRQRRPLLIGNLETVRVEGARAVVGPADVAELDLVDALVGVDIHREGDLEQFVPFAAS